MKTRIPIISLAAVAAAVLCAGCASQGPKLQVQWATLPPGRVEPSEQVTAAGPYKLYCKPSLSVVNLDPNYAGDDTPWIDMNDGFRERIAESMGGYDPEKVTLADMAVGRNGFLAERLGNDYVAPQPGRGDASLLLFAGKQCETVDYGWCIRGEYYRLFNDIVVERDGNDVEVRKQTPKRKMAIQVVRDIYQASAGGTTGMVSEVSVYLYGFRDHASEPVPKTTFTQMPEDLALALAVEGTERGVEGGRTMEVETPRGRRTMYRPTVNLHPDSGNWEWWAKHLEGWYVGRALVQLLNGLPEEELLRLQDANE